MDLVGLRAELDAATGIEDVAGQVLEVLGILDEALEPHGLEAVLVGGMAVYLWTATDAFLTKDIDLVLPTTPELQATLKSLGFGAEHEVSKRDVVRHAVPVDAGEQAGAGVRTAVDRHDLDDGSRDRGALASAQRLLGTDMESR